jgi:DNA-binding transcriptional ArsR family regulator
MTPRRSRLVSPTSFGLIGGAAFAEEWMRVAPLLAAAVADGGRELATRGLYGFLSRLSPELRVDSANETFSVDRRHEHEVFVDEGSTFTLTLSFYVWPHVRVNCDQPWPPSLVYLAPALRAAQQSVLAPEQLVRVLRALADPGRLQILRLIAERPRSNQELAGLIGMTEAGASRILRLLGEAGLLDVRRRGRYLLYRLRSDQLDVTALLEAFVFSRAADASREAHDGRR